MSKSKTPMTPKAAARIQGHADRHGTNQGFKARVQAAASAPPKASGTATTGKTASPSNGSSGK